MQFSWMRLDFSLDQDQETKVKNLSPYLCNLTWDSWEGNRKRYARNFGLLWGLEIVLKLSVTYENLP